MKDKVVLYGISKSFVEIFYAMRPCYDIVGICDKDSDKGIAYAKRLNCPYIPPDELAKVKYDILYVTTRLKLYTDICFELMHMRNVNGNKIQYYESFYQEKEFYFGEENPNETIYVLRFNGFKSGIGAMLDECFGEILARKWLELPPLIKIYIDWMNYSNIYLEEEELGKVNAWEKFFVQPCGLSAEEVYNSKHVVLTGVAPYTHSHKFDLEKLPVFYKNYICFNDKMKTLLEEEERRLRLDKNGTCAVMYRGTDYTLLKPYGHYIQPTIEQLIDKVYELKEDWGFDKIYFSTEDAKAHKLFLKEFGNDVIFSEREMIEEYPLTKSKVLGFELRNNNSAVLNINFNRKNDAFNKGMEYLRQAYFLSRCAYFVSGLTGGYDLVCMMSEGFKDSYIFDLGRYGHDDDSYATPWGHYVLLDEEKKKEKERIEEYKGKQGIS